jgi:hypothetical protein
MARQKLERGQCKSCKEGSQDIIEEKLVIGRYRSNGRLGFILRIHKPTLCAGCTEYRLKRAGILTPQNYE